MSYPVYTVPAGDVLPIFFSTYGKTNGESITLTGLAVTDIEIYKDGGTTQRASDAGYTLLDTDGIDFDSITGIHGFSIDTGDNTDAGFYTTGAWFHVVVSAVTVDSQTVNFVAAAFRIVAAEGSAGVPKADVSHFGGSAGTFASGRPEVNTSHIAGSSVSTTSAQIGVNVVQISGDATAADNLEAATDGTGYNVGNGSVVAASVTADVGITQTGADKVWSSASRSLSGGGVNNIWNQLTANITTASSIGKLLVDNVDTKVSNVETDTQDIQSRLPAALTGGGNIKADMLAISGDTGAADRLEGLMDGVILAQVNDASATTTGFIADGFTEATNDHFNGRLITFVSGALNGQQTAITDYVGATQTFTVTALTEAPANDDFFVIH
jgi:hypothetical protein